MGSVIHPVAACGGLWGGSPAPTRKRIAQILRAEIQEAAILEATGLRAGGFED